MRRNVAPAAVVFDLDGTLVDSMPLVLRAFAHALEPACGELTPAEIIAHLGGPPERTFQALIGTPEGVADAMERLRDYSLRHWRLIRPFDGMAELLDALIASRRSVGVWTGRERESAEWILNQNGIAPKLAACVYGDDLPTHKPHPGGLEETLRRLNVTRDQSLFVGDADVDLLAGAELGVRTLLITHGRHVEKALRNRAWRAVDTPAEAYALVRSECGLAR
ncbi:MAG: HAD hydrolase-like protein [Verrucomicrobia bacterium]|nr:HAD hydrolase-like protein [Verrucomicrobiota bacterium]